MSENTDNDDGAEVPMEVDRNLSADEDSWVCVQVSVAWPEEIPENRRIVVLQKAVQTLLNKENEEKADCHPEIMTNEDFFIIRVKPKSVVDQLCKEHQLTFKQYKAQAVVQFSLIPSAPPAQPEYPITDQPQATSLQRLTSREKYSFRAEIHSMPPTLASPTRLSENADALQKWGQVPAARHNSMALNANNESTAFTHGYAQVEKETLTFPVFPYLHLTNLYCKEICEIQTSNRVKIEGQASVSITAPVHADGKDSVVKAKNEFENLFKVCAQDVDVISVSVTHLDQGKVMEMLREIQRDGSGLVLTMSSAGCQISGPRDSLDQFQRKWRLNSHLQGSEVDLPKTLDMDLQDPLEKEGLRMNQLHWNFITHVFDKQVAAIQRKFEVEFCVESPVDGGEVKVTAVSTGDQRFPLTCHALTALLRLYQKAATDMQTCPLESRSRKNLEQIKRTFQDIRVAYPYVTAEEANGHWRLVGLAEHLGPAVEEVERKLGAPVFCKKAKQQLHCPKYSPTVSQGATADQTGVTKEETCPICMDSFEDKEKLKCNHEFCSGCLKQSMESMGPCCPVCKDVFGKMVGTQPEGRMKCRLVKTSLPGYEGFGTIVIDYDIPSGTQTEKHPNPGQPFSGTTRTAYLPDNSEGNKVLLLLRAAFDQKLIFTVGTSTTSGASNTVTWNDIHHKTCQYGGPESFGYPDPDYLRRVKEELKTKGIE